MSCAFVRARKPDGHRLWPEPVTGMEMARKRERRRGMEREKRL